VYKHFTAFTIYSGIQLDATTEEFYEQRQP